MIRPQIRLTDGQAQTLKALAAARQSSAAELICQSVDHLLRQSGSVDPVERPRRAIAVAGRFRSGQSDISARHTDYLAEADQG